LKWRIDEVTHFQTW